MNHRGRLILALLLIFGISGCRLTIENPLISPDDKEFDARLYGLWVVKSYSKNTEKVVYFLMFLPTKDKKCADLIQFGMTKDPLYWKAITGHINDTRYLNLKMQFDNIISGYCLAKYEIMDNDILKLVLVNDKFIEDGVKNKQLSGEIKKGTNFLGGSINVIVTASSEELVDFIKSQKEHVICDEKTASFFEYKDIGLFIDIKEE